MGTAFHQLYPRYSGTLTTAIRLWETFIGVGRGGGGQGASPQASPNNLREGGGNIPFGPPIIHLHFPSISMCNKEQSQMFQVEW